MKVLILHPPPYPVVIQFIDNLSKLVDLKVLIFGNRTIAHSQWGINLLTNVDFRFKILRNSSKYLPFFIKIINKFNPDIILSLSWWPPSFYAGILKKMFRYHFVIYTEAHQYTEIGLSNIKFLYRKFLNFFVDAYIGGTSYTLNFLQKAFPNKKIYYSLQSIDVPQWIIDLKKLPDKYVLRKKYDIPPNKIVLLGVGNLISRKNWIKAIETLSNLDKKYFLILVGDGPLKKDLYLMCQRLKLNNIMFVGSCYNDAIKEFYKMSDIFVFPTYRDQFGFVVMEALASGLPVVCSYKAGASELIKNGYNGFLIDPQRIFSKEIERIISNLYQMSKNALNSVSKYSLENRAQKFLEIFESVIKY